MPDVQEPLCEDEGNLEDFAGDEIPDPWDDENQTDWPNEIVTPAGEVEK